MSMVVGEDKLLSAKMIVLALLALKIGLNGFALFNVVFNPEVVSSQIKPQAAFIYQSLQNYILYFSLDTLIIFIGILGYFLFYKHRWYFLVLCLFLSLGLGLVLGGRF